MIKKAFGNVFPLLKNNHRLIIPKSKINLHYYHDVIIFPAAINTRNISFFSQKKPENENDK